MIGPITDAQYSWPASFMLWSDRLNLVASPDAVQATNESKKSEESEERGRKEKAETRREKVDDEVISRRPR